MSTPLSPLAALASAATLGVADFAGGVAGRRTSAPSVIVGMELCGFIALPFAVVLLPVQWDVGSMALTFVGGAVGGLGLIAFYRAMRVTLIGIVAPVTGVVAAGLPTLVGVLGGDRLHSWQILGIGVGLTAIALINGVGRGSARPAGAGVALALLAGAAFGVYFILFHFASAAGVAAFVSGRIGSDLAALVAALISGASPAARREAWRLIALAGAFDGCGNVLYLYASRTGLLSLTALLASFYPAFTVLCARLFVHERLTAIQTLGAGLAIAAVALIAAT
jgi:drug/metabolite transporter (DMT)-like permease